MKPKHLSFFLASIALLASMLACNLGVPAPTDSDAAQTPETGNPQTGPVTEAANVPGASACANPYLPIIAGATWYYNLTGPENDTFTRSIPAVNADGFTEQDVFGVGVTRQGEWKCENGNLVALNPSGGGSASVSAEGTSVDFQTTAIEGVTLPASINPGDSWSQSLTLEGTQTINGESFPASNQVSQNYTAMGNESVMVPAGTFDAMRVDCQVTMNITLDMGGNPLATTIALNNSNWYAIKVGLVKIVSTGSGLDSTIELTSYSIP
jgi:hypothetical protein